MMAHWVHDRPPMPPRPHHRQRAASGRAPSLYLREDQLLAELPRLLDELLGASSCRHVYMFVGGLV